MKQYTCPKEETSRLLGPCPRRIHQVLVDEYPVRQDVRRNETIFQECDEQRSLNFAEMMSAVFACRPCHALYVKNKISKTCGCLARSSRSISLNYCHFYVKHFTRSNGKVNFERLLIISLVYRVEWKAFLNGKLAENSETNISLHDDHL